MKNFRQIGDLIYVPAPSGGVASGDFVIVGTMYGVAEFAALAGAIVPLSTRGVYSLPKKPGTAWTVGQKLYWDPGNKYARIDSVTGAIPIGVATALAPLYAAAAASADVIGDVRLNGTY